MSSLVRFEYGNVLDNGQRPFSLSLVYPAWSMDGKIVEPGGHRIHTAAVKTIGGGGTYTKRLGKKLIRHSLPLVYIPHRREGDTSHWRAPLSTLRFIEGDVVDYYWGEDYWGPWTIEECIFTYDEFKIKPDGIGSQENEGGLFPAKVGVEIKLYIDPPTFLNSPPFELG